jgi:hypothetical protein
MPSYVYMRTHPVGGRKLKSHPACTGMHWNIIAKVDPTVNMAIKTIQIGKRWLDLTGIRDHLLNMPMRKGLHLVRSASRSRKNPIDSLMKLYAVIMQIE